MKIVEYAKSHPWATGIIVIIGGIIFLSITGVFGSSEGGSGGGGSSRPSDAEVMANAQISAAQISAQAATSAAQIGAGQQMNSDNLAAQVAMRTIEAQEKLGLASYDVEEILGLATIQGQTQAVTATINAQQQQYNSVIGSLGKRKKKDRDEVLKSLVTGQYGYTGNPNQSLLGSIGISGGDLAGIAKTIAGFI